MNNPNQRKSTMDAFSDRVSEVVCGGLSRVSDGVSHIFRQKSPEQEYARLTYEELVIFARKCKGRYPEVSSCVVVVKYLRDCNKYQVMQVMRNAEGLSMQVGGETVGRIITARGIEDRICALIGIEKEAAQFTIPNI